MMWFSITILIVVILFLLYSLYRVNARVEYFISNLEETFFSLESYREHLEIVYGLETYYGDDTLQALLRHSRELSDFLQESQQVFSLNEKEFLEYVESKDDTSQEEAQKIEE